MTTQDLKQPETPTSVDAGCYRVAVLQFLRPAGQPTWTETNLTLETMPLYRDMIAHGCRFEAEVLTTGEVSVTISNGDEDVDCTVTANGPDVQRGMSEMLNRRAWI